MAAVTSASGNSAAADVPPLTGGCAATRLPCACRLRPSQRAQPKPKEA